MVSLIVAVSRNGVIGCENRLIWHISEDLRRFKSLTTGHPVVMGRKTWESLGSPLPNRTNVVITRNPAYRAPGAVTVGSPEEAFGLFPPEEEVFVIGGGEVYRQAMPLAQRLYLTEVDADYDGDTFFPDWNREQWMLTAEERYERGEKFDRPFRFLVYDRK